MEDYLPPDDSDLPFLSFFAVITLSFAAPFFHVSLLFFGSLSALTFIFYIFPPLLRLVREIPSIASGERTKVYTFFLTPSFCQILVEEGPRSRLPEVGLGDPSVFFR